MRNEYAELLVNNINHIDQVIHSKVTTYYDNGFWYSRFYVSSYGENITSLVSSVTQHGAEMYARSIKLSIIEGSLSFLKMMDAIEEKAYCQERVLSRVGVKIYE